MGLPVYREPTAPEAQTKGDPTAESRSSIRRQPRVRSSRRFPHFERTDERPTVSDIWHSSSRPSNTEALRGGERWLQERRTAALARRGQPESDARSNASAVRPRSRRGPSLSNATSTLNANRNSDLEFMPPLRRMSRRNIADEIPRLDRTETQINLTEDEDLDEPGRPGLDGLGDRQRSTSPLTSLPGDDATEPWSNIAVTLIPDANLPSTSTSFASGAGAGTSFDTQGRRTSSFHHQRIQRTAPYSMTPGVLPGDDFTTLVAPQQGQPLPWDAIEDPAERRAVREYWVGQVSGDPDYCEGEDGDDNGSANNEQTTTTESSSEGEAEVDATVGTSTQRAHRHRSREIEARGFPVDLYGGPAESRGPTRTMGDMRHQQNVQVALRQECDNLHATLDSFLSDSSNEQSPLPREEIRRMRGLLRHLQRGFLSTARRSRRDAPSAATSGSGSGAVANASERHRQSQHQRSDDAAALHRVRTGRVDTPHAPPLSQINRPVHNSSRPIASPVSWNATEARLLAQVDSSTSAMPTMFRGVVGEGQLSPEFIAMAATDSPGGERTVTTIVNNDARGAMVEAE